MSTLKVNNIGKTSGSTQDTMEGMAKAWYQVDGTGTATIDDSHNTSSLVDESTGQYTVSYTNNMNNSNYGLTQGVEYTYSGSMVIATYSEASKVTGSCRPIHNAATGGAAVDVPETSGCVHGDLA